MKHIKLRFLLRGLLLLSVLTVGETAQAKGKQAQSAPSPLPFILHSFDGTTNGGSNPDAGPLSYVQSLGRIYGTTTGFSGPTAQTTGTVGTVFSLLPIPNGDFTTLTTIAGGVLNNGLALGFDATGLSQLYGTNQNGDQASQTQYGEIFGFNPTDNTSTPTYSFDDVTLLVRDPHHPTTPQAGLAAASDGYLYGTTRYAYDISSNYITGTFGMVYRLQPGFAESTFEILHRFSDNGSEGHPMKGALPLVTSSGVIYGVSTTSPFFYGGPASSVDPPGIGFLYKYDPSVSDPTQRFQIVKQLDPAIVGNFTQSQAGLVQGPDGMLYGTSDVGGAYGNGTVYRINPADNSVSVQYSFDDTTAAGGVPIAGLTVGADNNLYGTTTLTIIGFKVYPGSVFRLRPDKNGNYSQLDLMHQFAAYDVNNNTPEGLCRDAMIEVNHVLFGVCNKGGQFNDGLVFQVDETSVAVPLPAPNITKLTYVAHNDGTSEVDVVGTNFVNLPTADIGNTNEAGLYVTYVSATQLTLNLPVTLNPGAHLVTITNPDAQSGTGSLTTLDAPAVLSPPTAVTDTNGVTHLIVSGYNFASPGYNGYAPGSIVAVQAVDAQGNVSNVDTTVVDGPTPAGNPVGPQQYILTLNSTDAGSFTAYDHFNVEVFNGDGQHSVLPIASAHTLSRSAKPEALVPDLPVFHAYTEDQTKYNIIMDPNIGKGLSLYDRTQLIFALTGFHPPLVLPPTQVLIGQLSSVQLSLANSILAQGSGTGATGLISQDGGNLISQDGSNLVGHDGASLISQDGGNLVGHDGASLISQDGSNIVSQGAGNIVSQGAGNIVSQGAGNLVPVAVASIVADVTAGGGLGGSLSFQPISSLVGHDGASLRTRSLPDALFGFAAEDQSAAPVTFTLTHHDEGPTHGTGSVDGLVSIENPNGNTTLVLDILYTPGQPDIIEYIAPGVTLTPTAGTPTPQVVSPAPTLSAVSPNAVPAGSGATTLTVSGTLFTSGSVVSFNGLPLATTVISGSTLTVFVPAGLLTAPGAASITVTNPAPGGGTSGAVPFTVNVGIPPTTTATVTGTRNTAGAYTTAATVILTVAPGSFPVAATTYSVDNGPQQTYTAPFTISATGTHVVTFGSTDTAGNVEATQTLRLTLQPIAHVFPSGLQLLSVPADYSGVALSAALSVPNPKLAVWSPTLMNYVLTPTAPADALRPGLGYWARVSQSANLYDLGTPTPTSAPFAISLQQGWNMIGDPFPANVSLANVKVLGGSQTYTGLNAANAAGLVGYTLYSYPAGAGNYQTMDGSGSLTPYTGYWLYAFVPCTLQVSAP